MSEEQPTYKVTDRRLFNPDGSPREVPPDERPAPAAAPVISEAAPVAPPAVAPESKPEAPPVAEAKSPEPEPQISEEDPEESELPGADDPSSFASFLMSIASNAASSLGMMEHPVSGKREVDLELGKHWIDILGMLQKKTRGNLLPQEQQILEGLLADLRMQYVSLTNATPPQARAYSGRDITGG
ncbi:MAG TPA: DUF1844 domain-containing protein [Pyrinomonadaceae bacterium]|nr:DUF1844 domain-containing protein [Pyrinomonadaceae bacterium]